MFLSLADATRSRAAAARCDRDCRGRPFLVYRSSSVGLQSLPCMDGLSLVSYESD